MRISFRKTFDQQRSNSSAERKHETDWPCEEAVYRGRSLYGAFQEAKKKITERKIKKGGIYFLEDIAATNESDEKTMLEMETQGKTKKIVSVNNKQGVSRV